LARPKTRRLEADPVLRAKVVALLEDGASPRQINARLRWAHPDNEATRISHEQFYQASYVQGAGSLRQQLRVDKALRSGRTRRLPRSPLTGLPRRSNRSWIEAARISARPPEADDRAVPGHWEGDLVIGAGRRSVLITLAGARQPLLDGSFCSGERRRSLLPAPYPSAVLRSTGGKRFRRCDHLRVAHT